MHNFMRGVTTRAVFIVPVAFQAVTSMATLAFLTRALDIAEYGQLAVLLTWQQGLTVLATLGLPSVIASATAEARGQWRPISVLPVMSAGSIIAGAAFIALSFQGLLLGLVTLFSALATLQLARLRGLGKGIPWAILTTIMGPVGQIAGTVAVGFVPSATAYLAAWAGVAGVATVVTVMSIPAPWLRPPWRPDCWTILGQSLPLLGGSLAVMMSRVGDRILIGAIGGATMAGTYQAPYSIGNFSTVTVTALFSYHVSSLMRHDDGARRRFLRESIAVSMTAAGGSICGVVILLPEGIRNPQSFLVALTVSLASIPMAFSSASEVRLIHEGRTRLVGLVGIGTALTYLSAVALLLVSNAGIIAVALCTPMVYILSYSAFRILPARLESRAKTVNDANAKPRPRKSRMSLR